MGTYTTNYQLYMPTVGETGWGILVNGNFTTIDSTMKSLSNRITAVENEVNGNLNCTSVTATTGTFSGAVTAASLNVNGRIIRNGTINVSYGTNTIKLPGYNSGRVEFMVLPYIPGVTYTGKIKTASLGNNPYIWNGKEYHNAPASGNTEYSFTDCPYLVLGTISGNIYEVILS